MHFAERGINLTACHQTAWAKKRLQQLSQLAIALLLAGLFAAFALQQAAQLNRENLEQQSLRNQQQNQQAQLAQKIAQFKQQPQSNGEVLFRPEQIHAFLTLLENIPIKNGGLEIAQLYQENTEQIKLIGKYQNQTEVQQLQEYIAQQNKTAKLEYLHTNENSVEFSLLISEKSPEENND